MANEPTSRELMDAIVGIGEAVQSLASHMDEEFAKVRSEMATKSELASELGKIRAEMATKDFVDRRFNQMEAKIGKLTDTLEKKRVITQDEARDVMTAS